jgi:hypothetical protein
MSRVPPESRDMLLRAAHCLARAVETDDGVTGIAIPANVEYARDLARRLALLAEGVPVARAFSPPPRPGGRPAKLEQLGLEVAAAYFDALDAGKSAAQAKAAAQRCAPGRTRIVEFAKRHKEKLRAARYVSDITDLDAKPSA